MADEISSEQAVQIVLKTYADRPENWVCHPIDRMPEGLTYYGQPPSTDECWWVACGMDPPILMGTPVYAVSKKTGKIVFGGRHGE